MKRPNYLKLIEQRVFEAPEGTVFITSDFFDIADTQVINKALSRLVAEGKLRRVIRGVYDKPWFSELLQGYAPPSISNVSKAIARNHGWRIVPCGDTALNILRLSTQVPAIWSFVSDGPYRSYSVCGLELQFKHGANRDIDGMSEKSALVAQALKALGKDNIEQKHLRRIAQVLSEQEKQALLDETKHGTSWINKAAKEICKIEVNP
jgi:hypothetical protein